MSARTELMNYTLEHTRVMSTEDSAAILIDLHFFKVLVGEQFDKQRFRGLFDKFVDAGQGEFGPVTLDRIKAGPSYVKWGGWIGDQGIAMQVMAAGHAADLWDVVTPATLGFTGAEGDALAGRGFVMTSGLKS